MILWVMLAMIAVAAAAVGLPLLRSGSRRADPTAEVIRRQYAEADPATDAARRLLAETPRATARPERPMGRRARFTVVGGLLFVLVLGTAGVYVIVGAPELANAPPGPPPAGTQRPDLTAELEQRVLSAPDDASSWNRLGVAYAGAARFSDAAMVFARAARLDPQTAVYPSAEGEALAEAAKGQVTLGARAAFRAALAADPSDPRARYYLALAKDQSGDHKGAMADWNTLIQSAPPNAPWLPQVRAFVARANGRVQTGNQ